MTHLLLIKGDCLEVLPHIPNECIDLIITDPPYNIAEGAVPIYDTRYPKGKRRKIGLEAEWDKFTDEEFLHMMYKFIDEVYRILKPSGTFICFTSDRYLSYLRTYIRRKGMVYRQTCVWIKCLHPDTAIYIKNIQNGLVSRCKLGDLLNLDISQYQILTPKGFKRILGIQRVRVPGYYKLDTQLTTIYCSANHRFPYFRPRNNIQCKSAQHIANLKKKPNLISCSEGIQDSVIKFFDFREIPEDIIAYFDWKKLGLTAKELCEISPQLYQKYWCPNRPQSSKIWWYLRRNFVPLEILKEVYHNTDFFITSKKFQKPSRIPVMLPLDKDLGFAIGLFVAEGHFPKYKNGQIHYSLNSSETDLQARIANYLKRFDIELYSYKEGNKLEIYFGDKAMKRVFQQFVLGSGARGKRLNVNLILNTPVEFREGIIEGVLRGDGTKDSYRLGLSNKPLLEDIKAIMFSVGQLANKICQVEVSCKGKKFDSYRMTITRRRRREDIGDIPITIRNIKYINKEADFIDIAVEGEYFIINDGIVTHNSNPVPQMRKVKFMHATELFFLVHKEKGHDNFRWELGQHPNVFYHPIVAGKERTGHPTQKPLWLFEELIKYSTREGDLILDPFLGSGTTLVAARNLNRNAIGIEINDEYINMAKRRVAPEQRDLFGNFEFYFHDWQTSSQAIISEFISKLQKPKSI